MEWLAGLSVRRPIVATVLILAISVVGVVAYTRLGVDRFPKIDIPMISIATRLPGAAPEDVETEITDKIEEAVNTISGIDELRSASAEGVSLVYVSFVLEKDIDVAAQEVRDKINSVIPNLPRNIDQPTVTKMDPDAAPVVTIALDSDRPIQEITEFADKRVRRRIESVNGVGRVNLIGSRERQVNVWLDPIKLRSVNLTSADVERALAAQNLTSPGGRIEAGPREFTLRINGRVKKVESIGEIVVREVNGHPIRVRDVARVEDGVEDAETAAFRNGKATVLLQVLKQSGSNTVAVVDEVRSRLEDVRKQLPPGYRIDVVRDDSGVIRTSVHAVSEHLILGALFASLIVLIFLGNLRSTIIAAVAIPTSIIGTFALMWYKGFTLNTITLLALALAVGIVIDDAIVVLENIFRYIDEKKYSPREAALEATKEISLAVLATTVSLIVIFLPIVFLGGIPGRFLSSFGLTMAFAIGVSLLVSFTLTPMMSSRMLKKAAGVGEPGYGKKSILERIVDVGYLPVERMYMSILRWVMVHRWTVVVASLLTLGSCVPLVQKVKKGFLPRSDEAQLQLKVRVPEGTSLAQTALIGERYARMIREQIPSTELTLVTVGDDEQRTPNEAHIYVHLTPPETRTVSQEEVMDQVRQRIVSKAPPEYRVTVSEVSAFSGGGFSTAKIQYVLNGPDLKMMQQYADSILGKLRKVPGAVDVDSSMIVGKPEIGVAINRERAADLGVQVSDIASALRLLVGGSQVSTYEERGEQYEVHARAERQYRADESGLGLLTVPSSRLGNVPLSSVVDLQPATGPSVINRLNRQRQITLMANAAPGYGDGEIGDALKKIITDEKLPGEYRVVPAGQTKEMGKVMISFAVAFVMSFIFMYLVLAAQFNSWLHPITILISLPLTLPFAFLSLIMLQQTLNMFSMLGILVLFGVVKKNSILQIDHTNHLRLKGMPRMEAILHANKDRLRPILMTTFAFVAGMIPLAMSNGVGAGFNRATAGVVLGGQILSLLLTLLATPVVYSLFDDLSRWFRRVFKLGAGEFEESERAEGVTHATSGDSIIPVPAMATEGLAHD
jgi:hydrophobe/amphiphile efflux-1 (HAE1) family protein